MKARAALWVLALSAAVRLAVALGTEVTFDEAYYWTWSQKLGLGYFDHPPMVAWLVRALGVRGTALACGAVAVALMYGLAADLGGKSEAGLNAAALWSVLPASVLSGVFATPDAPLMPFWVGTLWALHRRRWALAGALAGGAMLSKYTGVLLVIPAAIAWAHARERWSRLFAAVAAALLVFSPVLAWNAAHDWASVRFQLGHGLSGYGDAGGIGARRLLDFLGGQLAVGGLLFPVGLYWAFKDKAAPLWLRSALVAPVMVFAAAALLAPGQANWAMAAYAAPCASLGLHWPKLSRAVQALGAAVCVLAAVHLIVPLARAPRDAALERTHGWSELSAVRRFDVPVAYAPNFGLAAEVAYQGGVKVAIAGNSRLTQFDLWPEPQVPLGGDALYVSEWDDPPPEALARSFGAVEGPTVVPSVYRGRALHQFHLWRLKGATRAPDRERPALP